MLRRSVLTLCSLLLTVSSVAAGDWPGFRGPNGDGTAAEDKFPTEWGPEKNITWRFELPGPGNSSPIVSGGRVFITCAEEDGKQRNLYSLDRKTGKLAWKRTVEYNQPEKMHHTNPYCASTPAADGKRVVVWEGSAGLFCYDFEGNELWSRDLGKFTHIWGYGSSPVIDGERIFLNCGPGERSFLAAFDLQSGEDLWRYEFKGADTRRPQMIGSWSTPLVLETGGEKQVLLSLPDRVRAFDPATGDVLWTLGGLSGPNGDLMYTSPVISDGVAVAMAGFTGPAVGFELGGSGDVTKTNTLWKTEGKQPQRIGSGVAVKGNLYIANADTGTAQCFDVGTGEVRWEARLAGGSHWGSTVCAGGRLYSTNQSGTTWVFHPNPEKFDEIAVNRLRESTNATPAFSDGRIFLRTDNALYCIGD